MIAKDHMNQWSDFPEQLKLKLTDHAVRCTSLEGTSHYLKCLEQTWTEEVGVAQHLSSVARSLESLAKKARTGMVNSGGSETVDTSILAQLARQR